MGITSSTKELYVTAIPCGGSFTVTLGLTAAPDITENPTDIVLILDRSGSKEMWSPLTIQRLTWTAARGFSRNPARRL